MSGFQLIKTPDAFRAWYSRNIEPRPVFDGYYAVGGGKPDEVYRPDWLEDVRKWEREVDAAAPASYPVLVKMVMGECVSDHGCIVFVTVKDARRLIRASGFSFRMPEDTTEVEHGQL